MGGTESSYEKVTHLTAHFSCLWWISMEIYGCCPGMGDSLPPCIPAGPRCIPGTSQLHPDHILASPSCDLCWLSRPEQEWVAGCQEPGPVSGGSPRAALLSPERNKSVESRYSAGSLLRALPCAAAWGSSSFAPDSVLTAPCLLCTTSPSGRGGCSPAQEFPAALPGAEALILIAVIRLSCNIKKWMIPTLSIIQLLKSSKCSTNTNSAVEGPSGCVSSPTLHGGAQGGGHPADQCPVWGWAVQLSCFSVFRPSHRALSSASSSRCVS